MQTMPSAPFQVPSQLLTSQYLSISLVSDLAVLALRSIKCGLSGGMNSWLPTGIQGGHHLMILQGLLCAAACCRVDVHRNALPRDPAILQQQGHRADHVPAAAADLYTPGHSAVLKCVSLSTREKRKAGCEVLRSGLLKCGLGMQAGNSQG